MELETLEGFFFYQYNAVSEIHRMVQQDEEGRI